MSYYKMLRALLVDVDLSGCVLTLDAMTTFFFQTTRHKTPRQTLPRLFRCGPARRVGESTPDTFA